MLMSLGNMEIRLAEESVLAFRDARDTYLECTEGIVWLTVEGQSGDYLLAKGKKLHIESNNLALIQGLPSASVRLLSIVSRSIRQENRFAGVSICSQYIYLNT
jgi:hypothetical protein